MGNVSGEGLDGTGYFESEFGTTIRQAAPCSVPER